MGQIYRVNQNGTVKIQFYINGSWVDSVSGADFGVINPSTEEVYATISLGSDADSQAAVAAAKQAFKTWALSSKAERLELMERISEIYTRRSDEMGETISREMGAPVDMSKLAQSGAGGGHIIWFNILHGSNEHILILRN